MSTRREDYVQKLKLQLDTWNQELDELEKRARELRSDAQSAYRERIAALRSKRQEVEHKLKDLRTASETAWEAMKSGLEEARDEFRRAFQETKSEGPSADVKPILEAGEPLTPPTSGSPDTRKGE